MPRADRGQKSESQRWQERHGDDTPDSSGFRIVNLRDISLFYTPTPNEVIVGDEVFNLSDFEEFEPRKKSKFNFNRSHSAAGE